MKIVSFLLDKHYRIGLYTINGIYDLNACNYQIMANMNDFLMGGERMMDAARRVEEQILQDPARFPSVDVACLSAPVPYPSSVRDAYAFRQHVQTSRSNRGLDMIPEFDQFPVFYFSNHQAVYGQGDIFCMPDHFQKLDFELEIAVVLNKKGRNISAQDAGEHIAGYMIMNDFSARSLQMEEMKLSLGPAKGKDFATTFGPWLVTPDELAPYLLDTPLGHEGELFDLRMTAALNGEQISNGNMCDMQWTFAEIIERCSYGATLFPGDIIGSGTVGTGCLLEINGTAKRANPDYKEQWLCPNDTVTLEVTGLGVLTNTIVSEDNTLRIFKKKE
ncbi:fumarylacetoacetate hydrolase family protein [Olivibacter sp. SDN3]|uniref:fumarylacetoacetate hydrolase family protein n=1 Tax=Olivibacter sp. SDN3 TaxID=2764720 RepID=UPI00165108AE|nr:fumarylacetoacetate hydrolase family protein [Olivibacter sp. SDN3]QNL48345.1 fumarylacetoacetate hydrolase family protein [Olivibacter sp. SDN3]